MLFRKLDKKYWSKEEEPMTDEQKDALYRHGLEAGIIGTASGLATYGLGKLAEHTKKKGGESLKVTPETIRKLKAGGIGLAGVSSGLAGYTAYKHHKYKKSKKEDKKDDNSKK